MALRACSASALALTIGLLVGLADGWRSEGYLPRGRYFAEYVGKFCFDAYNDSLPGKPEIGKMFINVSGRMKTHNASEAMYFLTFDDTWDHWQRVRLFWHDLSCEEMRELANYEYRVSNFLTKPPYKDRRQVTVSQEVRPRFWYFVFLNCGAETMDPTIYSIHTTNIHQGFEAEFGKDVVGSLALEATFAVCFFLLAAVASLVQYGRRAQTAGGSSSALLRLLGTSAGCSAIGCGCRALHHLDYASDGRGVLFLAVMGTFFACVGKALLTVLQFMIAKGFALFTPEERAKRLAIAGVLAGVITVSVGCEIWEQYYHDQSTSFYLHESWPGRLSLALNLCLLTAAWRFTWLTYSRETQPEVKRFYVLASAACGVYFAALPVICLLAELLDPWVRRKYVERVEVSARFVASATLFACLLPSRVASLVAARLKNRDAPGLLGDEAFEENELSELREVARATAADREAR
eukprot:TRINITY_DN17058_c0_g2_i1.p1 TRINITY_DN17058_c0_g2~~TRINITY_DN17058_c0_g2_i1.p1  ORF type:complete len:494 (-),score=103.23 TRINITY_DN17058_c0_g2_i1:68-1462(-)